MTYSLALALAAALLDVTIGYPARLARAIGTPAGWIAAWLAAVRGASAGWPGGAALAVYLAPVAVAAAVVAQALPSDPIGFAVTALLSSAFCGRQSLDRRARAAIAVWEGEGPGAALAALEALGAEESEIRLAPAGAAAIAARFADEAAAPTVFILVGGLVGAVLCQALALAGRACREGHDGSKFARGVAVLEAWTLAPAARLGAFWIAAASGRASALRALAVRAATPTAPAQGAMRAALGEAARDEPAYLRRALALFRRAGAAEILTLAALALASAALFSPPM